MNINPCSKAEELTQRYGSFKAYRLALEAANREIRKTRFREDRYLYWRDVAFTVRIIRYRELGLLDDLPAQKAAN